MTQPRALAAAFVLALALCAACGKYGPPVRSQPEATTSAVEQPTQPDDEREPEPPAAEPQP